MGFTAHFLLSVRSVCVAGTSPRPAKRIPHPAAEQYKKMFAVKYTPFSTDKLYGLFYF
jgi:hypothetical protein